MFTEELKDFKCLSIEQLNSKTQKHFQIPFFYSIYQILNELHRNFMQSKQIKSTPASSDTNTDEEEYESNQLNQLHYQQYKQMKN